MKRWQKGVIFGGLGLFALAGYVYTRLLYYTRETDKLILVANDFPRQFSVGGSEKAAKLLVVFGDSTAAGVGASSLQDTIGYKVASGLATHGMTIEVQNFAVSGARLQEVMRQMDRKIRQADYLLISISANDATHGTSLTIFEAKLRELLRILAERTPEAKIVFTSTPNFRYTPALPSFVNSLYGLRASDLSNVIRNVSKEFPNVVIADLFKDGTLKPYQYSADGFHPNEKGYAVWAQSILRALG